MKLAKPLLYGFFIVTIIAMGFVIWASSAIGPAPEAFAGLRSDEHVTVSLDQYLVFQPARKKIVTAFVFYPGGRVDYRSYAVPLHKIAAEGYLVILLPVRLNLALFDVNAANEPIRAYPEIRHWVVGGHSLGGVAAATFASRHENIDGVVLWAANPADDALKNTDMQILSIYATLDMNGLEQYEASRNDLPATTAFVAIEGGNHGQFGNYGFHPGDHEATISRAEQQKQVVEATLKFLKEVSE
ncbi:MAG TPA: alpha/beta hydrolase [Anaerolineales bacterium]|nr:alpha/beta hydrolase [Anaerolineales bacterium]